MKDTPNPVCEAARRTLDEVTRGLGPGEGRTLQDRLGVHMALRVSCLPQGRGALFSVGHSHESRVGSARELISDPEVVLYRAATGEWTPLSMQTPFVRVVTVETSDTPRLLLPAEHVELVKFVEVWMRNVEANLLRGNVLEREIEGRLAYAAE